jgi:MFS family permease
VPASFKPDSPCAAAATVLTSALVRVISRGDGVTRYHWLVLFVAWLGWVFDAMDATIYALVLHPALHDLLPAAGGGPISWEAIAWYGGIIFSVFLIGWAVGGVLFGVLADRIGRTRTLVFTILIYAAFTGLAAVSATWWQLALFRFLTALGIGGEWAAGAALVAEVWPEEKRAKAAGLLQSAWAAGFLIAVVINVGLRDYGWRPVFVVGVAPALVALLVRLGSRNRSAGSPRTPPNAKLARKARRGWRSCLLRRWRARRSWGQGWLLWPCSACGARRIGRRR